MPETRIVSLEVHGYVETSHVVPSLGTTSSLRTVVHRRKIPLHNFSLPLIHHCLDHSKSSITCSMPASTRSHIPNPPSPMSIRYFGIVNSVFLRLIFDRSLSVNFGVFLAGVFSRPLESVFCVFLRGVLDRFLCSVLDGFLRNVFCRFLSSGLPRGTSAVGCCSTFSFAAEFRLGSDNRPIACKTSFQALAEGSRSVVSAFDVARLPNNIFVGVFYSHNLRWTDSTLGHVVDCCDSTSPDSFAKYFDFIGREEGKFSCCPVSYGSEY